MLTSKDLEALARFALDVDHKRPSEAEIGRYHASPATLKLAAALETRIRDLAALADEKASLFRRMPHYNVLLALAYKATREERKAASQRQNAQRARTPTFPIGPIIWDSVRRLRPDLTIPEEVITATRLPRTLAGAIEDRLRREAKLQDNAPTLWRWIKAQLGPSAVLTEPKKRNPRRDALLIEMEGRQERLSYVQFQKILTKARQREKTLGDFLEPLARA